MAFCCAGVTMFYDRLLKVRVIVVSLTMVPIDYEMVSYTKGDELLVVV